jgi:hypothetical protein
VHIHAGKNAIPANDYFLSILDAFLVDCKTEKQREKTLKSQRKEKTTKRK